MPKQRKLYQDLDPELKKKARQNVEEHFAQSETEQQIANTIRTFMGLKPLKQKTREQLRGSRNRKK